MGGLIDITGQRFGKLVVKERDLTKKGNGAYWICECDCGTVKSIRGSHLRITTNPTRSCGCLAKENHHIDTESLVGKEFGRLTVLERDLSKTPSRGQSSYWICECECGQQISVSANCLLHEHTQSCGCLQKELSSVRARKDIAGQRFGFLVALEDIGRDEKRQRRLWRCRCDCGEECVCSTADLFYNPNISCGCQKRRSQGEAIIYKILEENNYSFLEQYYFSDLRGKNKRPLVFDFVIFDNQKNITAIIEFDGEQHYEPTSYYYSEKGVEYDKKKNEYCLKNNYPLYRIPYTEMKNLNIDLLFDKKFLVRESENN